MLYQSNTCPICHGQIDSERLDYSTIVCQNCGWTQSMSETTAIVQMKRSYLKVTLTLSVLGLALFFHTVYWGQFSTQIIPLKVKQLLGFASPKNLRQVADICVQREKWTCVEGAYRDYVTIKPKDSEVLSLYGQAALKNGNKATALRAYRAYFQAGGKGVDEALHFANLLSESQDVHNANEFYKFAIGTAKDSIRISGTQAYVNHLVKYHDLRTAQLVIENFRRTSSQNAAYFMEGTLREIRRLMAAR